MTPSNVTLSILASMALFSFEFALASGLDVQLKDIKRSHYFSMRNDGTTLDATCKSITSEIVKKNGPLTHCHPMDNSPTETWVECPIANGEKILAFEVKADCEKKRIEASVKK